MKTEKTCDKCVSPLTLPCRLPCIRRTKRLYERDWYESKQDVIKAKAKARAEGQPFLGVFKISKHITNPTLTHREKRKVK